MSLLQSLKFTSKEGGIIDIDKMGVQKVIDQSGAFDFDMSDIARIRKEMKILIKRLSRVYLP
jgi:hypothetical protein